MKASKTCLVAACVAATAMGTAGCGAPTDGTDGSGDSVDTSQDLLIGDHLRGIADADFASAKAAFATVETINDGLGPVFNDSGCGNCHTLGASGGAGESIERRYGKLVEGVFNPLANEGGSLRQLKTLGNFTNKAGKACSVPLETEPADATVHNVGRVTTPLFGLGLVDAMPDSFFQNLAKNEPSSVRGTVSTVSVALPDPSDPNQSVGSSRVGRFGWKAGVPNLVQFSADAYLNEMGITTQHCFKGKSITTFATESAPNGIPVANGCDDNVPGTDDQVGACTNGLTEIQDDVAEFTQFMTFLAPPPRGQQAAADTAAASATDSSRPRPPQGQTLFSNVGCNGCHSTTTFTTPRRPTNGVPGSFDFQPFSDFLVHDMGSLGDQIGNAGDSLATTRLMRTAPLWGVRFRTKLLHDGRATDIPTAIKAHDGQAATAARQFINLSSRDQATLVRYVLTL
jgi:CxxC motif-containing protein (DUF1111 family)